MSGLAELLRLAKDGPEAPPPKDAKRSGSTREEVDLAVREYQRSKSPETFEAMIELARDYKGEE